MPGAGFWGRGRGGLGLQAGTLNASARNLQNIKDRHTDQPAEERHTLPHSHIVFVEPPWLEKQKRIFRNGCICEIFWN